ncbi:hypothetical protein MO973_21945 [Paenibacillus sp. TRM 82003]|nr:hypothetical protein [Paenibacillus sp. TRM 82003]
MDFSWAEGKLTGARIRSGKGNTCVIFIAGEKYEIMTEAGATYAIV